MAGIKRSKNKSIYRHERWGYIFVMPFFLAFLLFFCIPLASSVAFHPAEGAWLRPCVSLDIDKLCLPAGRDDPHDRGINKSDAVHYNGSCEVLHEDKRGDCDKQI